MCVSGGWDINYSFETRDNIVEAGAIPLLRYDLLIIETTRGRLTSSSPSPTLPPGLQVKTVIMGLKCLSVLRILPLEKASSKTYRSIVEGTFEEGSGDEVDNAFRSLLMQVLDGKSKTGFVERER